MPIPLVPDVRSKKGHRYPQLLDAVELIFASGLTMFDPAPVVRVRRVSQGLLLGVQERTYRGVRVPCVHNTCQPDE